MVIPSHLGVLVLLMVLGLFTYLHCVGSGGFYCLGKATGLFGGSGFGSAVGGVSG